MKYWGTFLDTDNAPLFASVDQKQKDSEKEYIGQVALFTARYAYQAKDAARCEKYCDIAMKSEKEAKDALNLKLYVMKDGLKTHEDSLAYVNKLKGIFAQDETNEVVLDGLNSMYSSLKMEKEQTELLDAGKIAIECILYSNEHGGLGESAGAAELLARLKEEKR